MPFDDRDPATGSGLAPAYFARPAASPGLAAVAAFSQAQAHKLNVHYQASFPQLPTGDDRQPAQSIIPAQDIVPDRLLLSPTDPGSGSRNAEPRPSSRRALTKALELAREAVKLDSTNDDPYGAIVAYGKSVALLSKVMERVMRGEDSTESRRRGGRRRSVVAQEEEVRRLKAIHDTYADRMNILSLIYDIPTQPHSPTSLYPSTSVSASNSSASTRPPSPSSPASDSHSPPLPHHLHPDERAHPARPISQETAKYDGEIFTNGYSGDQGSGLPYHHPYAPSLEPPALDDVPVSQFTPHPASSQSRPPNSSRLSARPRAASNLPPPVPPPQNALPPAPDQVQAAVPQHLSIVTTRPRGTSTSSHVRTHSGGSKLEVLAEHEESPLLTAQQPYFGRTGLEPPDGLPRTDDIPFRPRDPNRDSHPLPPLPTSPPSERSSSDLATPRTQPVPLEPPTGSPDSASSSRLINQVTTMGTISLRRSKVPAPPSTSSGSPRGSPRLPDAAPPSALRMPPNTAGLPPVSGYPGYGRSRSSSQPGHRPNLGGAGGAQPPAAGTQAPYDGTVRPTLSMYGPSAPAPRKASVSHGAGKAGTPQILIVNGMLSPPLGPATPPLALVTQLVPPPPIPHATLPTTPTSPLPPLPPVDAIRKPYHMMGLLRHTMTSKSGGYITRRLHVPQEVWSQGGAKLQNVPEKVRVVEVLCAALEEVHKTSGDVFGPGNVCAGLGLGIGSIGKKQGDAWTARLEEFSSVCDGVVANFGKRLGVGEGFVTKKNAVASWSGKFQRQIGKLTNQNNLDSPAAYVQALGRLFQAAQLLDEHCKAITMSPLAPAYAALPMECRLSAESKLRRTSEFFASVVLTFVVRDLAQLLDKYVKKCEKWLAE